MFVKIEGSEVVWGLYINVDVNSPALHITIVIKTDYEVLLAEGMLDEVLFLTLLNYSTDRSVHDDIAPALGTFHPTRQPSHPCSSQTWKTTIHG